MCNNASNINQLINITLITINVRKLKLAMGRHSMDAFETKLNSLAFHIINTVKVCNNNYTIYYSPRL